MKKSFIEGAVIGVLICFLVSSVFSVEGNTAGNLAEKGQEESSVSKEGAKESKNEKGPVTESIEKFCCGNDKWKMTCEDNLVRCYENKNGQWKYTFGKYCKENIPDCYAEANSANPCCH